MLDGAERIKVGDPEVPVVLLKVTVPVPKVITPPELLVKLLPKVTAPDPKVTVPLLVKSLFTARLPLPGTDKFAPELTVIVPETVNVTPELIVSEDAPPLLPTVSKAIELASVLLRTGKLAMLV